MTGGFSVLFSFSRVKGQWERELSQQESIFYTISYCVLIMQVKVYADVIPHTVYHVSFRVIEYFR